jgi:hypothetical protein
MLCWQKVQRRKNQRRNKGSHCLNADEIALNIVWFSSATMRDHNFLDKLKWDDNIIYVFDKGYNDYKAFKYF